MITKKIKQELEEKYEITSSLSKKEIQEKYGNNFNKLLANLLFFRGVKNFKEAEKFLNPKWEDNFNPFLFKDMKKIVSHILKAIKNKESILIFSDYDADGITGNAILNNFFKKINYNNFHSFIPNRNIDGYGFTEKLATKICNGKIFDDKKFIPDLVITIDCGITNFKSSEILAKNKIDLIITDHHIANEKIPKAIGILNHKVKDEKYPEQILSGAGIVFKLVQALIIEIKKTNEKIDIIEGWEKWLLDLVAISTICDMVPLLGENRIFVKYGQIVLGKTRRSGLKILIQKSRINKNNISTDDIGFMIGPRINAASRLECPNIALNTLIENNGFGEEQALNLEKINNKRKALVAKIMKEVWLKLKKRGKLKNIIVIGNKDWPLGILGLIAGKIADKEKKAVFVWSKSKDCDFKIKGSCRASLDISIFDLMHQSKNIFSSFGGHHLAGGFEIEEEKIHFLEEELEKKIKTTLKINQPKNIIDAVINLDDVHYENYKEILKLEPYGLGNQKPFFLFQNIEIYEVKYFGKKKEHLELSFLNLKNQKIKAVKFFYKEKLNSLYKEKQKIHLVASMEYNCFNNSGYLRLKIEDILD